MTSMNIYDNLAQDVESTDVENWDVDSDLSDILEEDEALKALGMPVLHRSGPSIVPDELDDEYPTLGRAATMSTPTPDRVESCPRGRGKGTVLERFIVASSYRDDRRAPTRKFADRSFKTFATKTFATNLECTQACRFVCSKTDDEGNSTFGVCYRETCTYAHSMAEFKLPQCRFGDSCNRVDGVRKGGKFDRRPAVRCQFQHPSETVSQFYERTGRTPPSLPETSEDSRKPKTRKLNAPPIRIDLKCDKSLSSLEEAIGQGHVSAPLRVID